MPCLDEAATIETCIAKAQASMARLVEVDGRAVVTRPLGLGEFELRAPVSGSRTSSRVDPILSPTQVLPDGDGRASRGRLSEVEFVRGASE